MARMGRALCKTWQRVRLLRAVVVEHQGRADHGDPEPEIVLQLRGAQLHA
jgi:hypothetical protein